MLGGLIPERGYCAQNEKIIEKGCEKQKVK